MHLLWLVVLSGGSAWVTHSYLSNKAATEGSTDLVPRIMGYNATTLMGGLGVAALLFGSPMLAAIGVGAAVGSIVTRGTMALAAEAYDAGAQRQLPGPRPPAPAAPGARPTAPGAPARPKGGGFLANLWGAGKAATQQLQPTY